MKNTKTLMPVLAIILCVSLSCTFLKEKFVKSDTHTVNIKPEDIATFDPKAPLVSPGAIAVRRLADLDPTLSSHADAVEAVERAVLTKARDEMHAAIKQTGKPIETSDATTLDKSVAFAEQPSSGFSPASALMFQSGPYSPPQNVHDASLIANLVGGLKTLLMSDTKNGSVPNKQLSYTEPKDGPTTTTMTMDVGSGTDGSTTFGIGGKTESTKNGVKVVTEFAGKIEGMECPNAEGQLPITVKVRLGAGSGGTSYTQDLTAFVRATVNDNAQVAATTMDVHQVTEQHLDGRFIYVESGETAKGDDAKFANVVYSNTRIIQQTPNATHDEIDTLSVSGMNAAYAIGLAALDVAETKWQNGGCVQIEAASPGSVAVSSTTQIPVKVRHKYDGTEVPSKLEATLSGGSSVDPTLIPKTAGTLTYVAPGETNKTATIKLKAVSKRGIATLDLTATTGGNSYQIVGGRASWQTNTKVCDIMKPFTLTGGGLTVNFSGGLSGTYNYTGPYGAHGSGDTYSISLPDGPGKPGTMTGGGVGSAGGHSASDTETYKLSPIEPCSQ